MAKRAKEQNPSEPGANGVAPATTTAAASSAESGTISTEVAARLIMVGPERVRQLAKQGWIKKVGRDRYRVVDAVQGYINYLKDEQRRASKTASASRVQDMRAREIELRLAREDRTLIETEEAISFVSDALGKLRAGMVGLAARVTRDLPTREKIETEIDAEFKRAAESFKQEAAALRSGGGPLDAATEDDA